MAADTLVTTYGGTRTTHAHKIERYKKWLIGGAGTFGVMTVARAWIDGKANVNEVIDFGKIDDSTILMVSPKGVVYSADTGSGLVLPKHAPFAAIGSGTDAALGAFLMGATAIQAVEAGKQVDTGCGGGTVWLALNGDECMSFTSPIYTLIT